MSFLPRSMLFLMTPLAAAVAASPMFAADPPSDQMPKDRAGLDAYLHDFIVRNPHLLREALLRLDREEQVENAKRVLRELKGDLYHAGSPEIGAHTAKVKIVVFYDYNCPYCRATSPTLAAFLKANPDTTLVLKDVASFGEDSEAIARIALAANLQGKFEPLHEALMAQKGKSTEARALEAAAKIGLDVGRLKKDAASPAVADLLKRNRDLANRLNASVTPFFIIAYNGISGAPEDLVKQLTEYVGEVRKAGCDVC